MVQVTSILIDYWICNAQLHITTTYHRKLTFIYSPSTVKNKARVCLDAFDSAHKTKFLILRCNKLQKIEGQQSMDKKTVENHRNNSQPQKIHKNEYKIFPL